MATPTGGMYGMGNSTSLNGTGFASGTSAYKTGTTSKLPVSSESAVASDVVADSNIADAASDVSSCDASSEITTTVYTTDLVTMTITSEETASAQNSAMVSDAASADAAGAESSSTPTSSTASTVEEPDVEEPDVEEPGVEEPDAEEPDVEESDAEESSPAGPEMSSTAPESSSATTDSPAEKTDSVASEESYSSGGEGAAAAFYEVPEAQSAAPSIPNLPPSSPPTTGSSAGGKRGLAYNSAALTNAFEGTPMSWAYNWAASPDGDLSSGMEYVPMLWGPKAFGAWDAVAKSAVASGAKHMLSFNEPDLGAQANMDAGTAAEAHIKYMNPYADGIQIGSPAVTSGGPDGGTDGMGLTWMQKFLDKCAGKCKVDFLAVHWYGSAEDAEWLKKHIDEAIDVAKKNGVNKIWLTEFGVSGSNDQVANFLKDVMPWLDSKDGVERYAFFMCSDGHLISGNAMSDPVGKTYAS
jgi:Glycosyl hydrolase catalytic core